MSTLAVSTESVIAQVFGVFSEIGTWIMSQMKVISTMFYDPQNGLTFLGLLAVCGLGFSVIFLLIGIVQRFLHFRG